MQPILISSHSLTLSQWWVTTPASKYPTKPRLRANLAGTEPDRFMEGAGLLLLPLYLTRSTGS